MELFAAGLLAGRAVALSGGPSPAVQQALGGLGARLVVLEDQPDDELAEQTVRVHAPLHLLLHDAGTAFGAGDPAGLRDAVDGAWGAVRAVTAGALIPGERGGKIMLIAPAAGAGPHAEPARAALVNLARSLSVEWARYAITATTVLRGSDTTGEQLAALACFMASPGGDYLSGCPLTLGALAV